MKAAFFIRGSKARWKVGRVRGRQQGRSERRGGVLVLGSVVCVRDGG
jgi:hypothetical protein